MAQIKLAEYTFDNSVGDTVLYITPTTIVGVNEDVVNGNITTRTVYIDDSTMPTELRFGKSATYNRSLLTVEYLNIDTNITKLDMCFYRCPKLQRVNTSNWNTSNVTNFSRFCDECNSLVEIDVSHFNVSKANGAFYKMFSGVKVIEVLDVSKWNVDTTDGSLSGMFDYCSNVKKLDLSNWKVKIVHTTGTDTSIANMFNGCSSLEYLDLSGFDFSEMNASMEKMFHGCSSLREIKGIENFNVSKVTSFKSMFYKCSSLTKLDLRNWVTSSATSFQDMFASCHNLEVIRVDNFDTSKVTGTGLNAMFSDCKKVKTLNLNSFVNAGLGNFLNFCYKCESLEYISAQNFIWGNCNAMQGAFTNCKSLKMLDLTNFDGTTIAAANLRLVDSFNNITCPIYYNSNMCTANDTELTNKSNAIDVKGRLMAIYDFNNTVTTSDSAYPVLTGSTVTETIDTQGSESHITHRVIGVDVMPTAISFQPVTGLLNVDYLAVTNSCTSLRDLFNGCIRLSSVNTFGWDTQNVTTLYACFQDCGLTNIDLQYFNTSKVTDMGYLFKGSAIQQLDMSSFNTSSCTTFGRLCSGCSSLTTVKFGNWNTTKVKSMTRMFESCTSLIGEIDMTSFNTKAVTDGSFIFTNISNKENVIVYVHDTNWTISDNTLIYDVTLVRRLSKLIAKYTFDNTTHPNCLPRFNKFGGTAVDYIVSDIVKDNITTRFLSTDGDLPQHIQFADDDYAGGRGIISCDYLDTSNCTSLYLLFYSCSTLTSVNTSSWDTSRVTNFYCTFLGTRCTEIDCSNIDTSSATSISRMFDSCSTLTSLDLSSWDVSKVAYFDRLFQGGYGLKSLNISGWDTSSAINMSDMFSGCGLTELDVSHFNTSNVTNLSGMFGGVQIPSIDLSSWDVRKVQQTRLMFNSGSITEIKLDGWNTESLTDMWAMFCGSGITTVDINHFNVSKVTNVSQLFDACKNLVSVDMSNLHFTSCESISSMFSRCPNLTTVKMADFTGSPLNNVLSFCHNANKLTEIDVSTFDTSRVANLQNIFSECYALERIIGIEKWDTTNATGAYYAFNACSKISELDLSGWDTRKFNDKDDASMFYGWGSEQEQTVYYEPPYWDLNHKSFNNTANFVIKITRNNGYWLDMTGITGATEIKLLNTNNLPTEDILTDWGDGTRNSELTHTYSTAGEYIIVTNLQKDHGMNSKLTPYLTKAVIYHYEHPQGLFYNCQKMTEVTLTDNWVRTVNEKGSSNMWRFLYDCTKLTKINYPQNEKIKPSSLSYAFHNCQKITSIDLGWIDYSILTIMEYAFSTCLKLTEIVGIEDVDTSKVTNMNGTFRSCSSLTSLDLSSWDTSQCTDMNGMFASCTLLADVSFINEWDLSKVTSFNALCHGAKALTSFTLDSKDLSSLTDCNYMLAGNPNLQTIKLTNLTTPKTINVSSMFENDSGLTSVDFSGTIIKPKNTSLVFKGCSSLTSLDLSSWDVSQCTTLQGMFLGCTSLITLNLANWNTSKVRMMSSVFYNCPKLKNLDITGWDTSSVDNMESMFFNNQAGMSLDLSSFNTQKVTTMNTIFQSCIFSSLDISNWTINNTTGVNNMFNNCKVSTIGLLYASDATVNKITSLLPTVTKPTTIYYYDADPSQLTPVEGVTFKKYQVPTTIQLPPHIQLHSLPDGTRDEVDIKTGILTRNVGEIAITGQNINWVSNGFETHDGYTSLGLISDWGSPNYNTLCRDYGLPLNLTTTNSLSVNATMSRTFNGGLNYWAVTEWGAGKIGVHIPIEIATLSEAKQWLDENPIVIRYTTQTPTTEQLILNYNNSCDYGRILPTGMCDKYSVVDSMYTQTMASILLDGANTWDAMEEFENTVKFTATGTTVGVENLNMLGAGGLYCDNDLFPNINDDSDVPHCRVDEAGNKFYIYVDKEMLMSPDLIGWQIWLQANNFNMVYELAEHLTYVKPYEELDPTQARWEGMDCMRDGAINYHTNSSDNITMYPTLEYVAPSINNFEVTMLEPNTDYTIYAEGINKNDTINLGGTDINFNNGTVYTSGDNQWLRIDNNDSFYNMVITKGDTTGEVVPYFEGMTSVENPSVKTPIVVNGLLSTVQGKWESSSHFGGSVVYVPMIDVKVGQKYIIASSSQILVAVWRSKTWVNDDVTQIEYADVLPDRPLIFTPDVSQVAIFMVVAKHLTDKAHEVELRMYEGEVDYGYLGRVENPKVIIERSTVSYTDLKLRSLPNGVKDTINVVTGEYVQRVGEVVFDGTLNGDYTFATDTSLDIVTIRLPRINDIIDTGANIVGLLSDKYISVSSKQPNNITCYSRRIMIIKPLSELELYNSTEKIKAFLQQNPITVQYELAEPITTKLDPQTLLAYTDGTINLSSNTGLLPTTHYTVPSTNTFHLPSMKTGTRYTLKYPSASGSITIGDINYKISGDSMLFTTPLKINGDTSAIIFSDTNPENVMLIEGAYNKREVPFFTGVKSVKNPNITIIDQLSTESTTYNCETEIELRGLPNGVADKLDIIKGKLTTNVGIRPYQEGDENLPNIWTDGYETVYALSSPVVKNVTIDRPTVTTNSLIELSSDYLIPQLNYRAPSSNNFPLDLLQPNTTYTLYADTLVSGSYTLGGTKTGIYSQPHTITLGDITDNLLTFNGDLGLSNVMLVKGNSLKTTLPPYFLGIRSVTDGHLLVEGMAGEINELTFDEGIVLRDNGIKKDTIDLITGVLTKRTGEITLTGVEGWSLANTSEVIPHNDYVTFQLILGGVAYSNPTSNGALICDTLKHEYQLNMTHEKEGIYSRADAIRICVKKSRIGGDTVDALKAWLNQNPTTVVYTLKTPLEVPLKNVWTTPPTSYNNQTEISSTVSTNSLKPMISVTIATTTLEEIVSNLEAQNAQLEEENLATMLALTEVYEMMYMSTVDDDTEPTSVSTWNRRIIVSSIGMIYAKLVKRGVKSIEDIPTKLQVEVQYAIDNGLV